MYSHKRVVVALDGSTASKALLCFLMKVVLDDLETRRREAEEYLAPIAAALRAQGVDTSWAIRHGRPTDEILAAAAESGAHLIAMATHGRTGLGRLLFGSVAEAVLRHAPVPVFLIRDPHTVEAANAAEETSTR
jgi:nucleotide-binding universal stress UspA family protein